MKALPLYAVFVFSTGMLLADRLTDMYISNSMLHYTFLFAAAATFLIICGRLFFKVTHNKFIISTLVLVALVCFAKFFFTWNGSWRTQTIIYQSVENPKETIDFQMRGDVYAFGYKRRVVQRRRIVPCIDWITDVDTNSVDAAKWKRLDLKVNEMGIEGY